MRFKRVFLVSVSYVGGIYKGGDVPEPGLGYMAEILEDSKINYHVLDMNLGYGESQLMEQIRRFNPDLLGLGMKTFSYKRTYEIIKKIKKSFPKLKILVGGSHVSLYRKRVLEECTEVDFAAYQEGEEILRGLCLGKPLKNIGGLIYRTGKGIAFNPHKHSMHLDKFPYPRYRKFELEKYWYPARYIVTSRGCPNKCTFCSVPTVLGRLWRARSPENVIEEIQHWYDRGWRRFEILDDNFTLHKERAEKICDLIIEKGMKIEIDTPNGIRADNTSLKLLKKMKRAGWKKISYGVDGGNDRVLKIINKGETMEQIEKGVQDAIAAGLDVVLFFIIGTPGETMDDIEDSFTVALKYPIMDAVFSISMPYPGTELFDEAVKKKYLIGTPEEYMNSIDKKHGVPVVQTPKLSPDDVKVMWKKSQKIRESVQKRHRIRVLRTRYGVQGKILSLFYQSGIINDNTLIKINSIRNRALGKKEDRTPVVEDTI